MTDLERVIHRQALGEWELLVRHVRARYWWGLPSRTEDIKVLVAGRWVNFRVKAAQVELRPRA